VLDVKHGSGAFMPDLGDARALAQALVDVAVAAGLPTVALLTDMNQVLGTTAGNALEVRECIDILRGERADPRLVEVTLALCAVLLELGGLDADPAEALRSGAAAERFGAMTAALGGPADLLERPDAYLATAPVTLAVEPDRPGVVTAHATRHLGLVVLDLGGGRHRDGEAIDAAVGLSEVAGPGLEVAPGGRPLGVVHARDEASAQAAAQAVRAAITVGDNGVGGSESVPIVTERIG
jgi:thymidine phosphorylase